MGSRRSRWLGTAESGEGPGRGVDLVENKMESSCGEGAELTCDLPGNCVGTCS